MKSKGERERYTQLNTECQRAARRGKNVFFGEQCKGIEENNRRGKPTDLREIGNTTGTCHPEMGTIKDRNGRPSRRRRDQDKNAWKNCTKKDLEEPDNHDGVVSHAEPDILECEVSGPHEALLSRKLVDAMEFQ